MASFVASVLKILLPWALMKLMEWNKEKDGEEKTVNDFEKSVDQKLDNLWDALKEVSAGEKTPQKKEALKNAIRDFTRTIEHNDGV